ncbi:LANO_0B00760g1_1 [Lachancea nothofagi CBS 11611]|uniref:LANO_0B00760g1_1 n=1 Tax=Lachancea nothofagi CBS 11611 TaxID=1266666 RepID=A0A1G4IUJ9_9SACH|nr:LANO_0B00760g1_1 [Lachancea nothofagi CBS 11611]
MKYLTEHLPRIGTVTVILESEIKLSIKNLRSGSLELVDINGLSFVIELPHRIQINSGRRGLQKSNDCHTLRLKVAKDAGGDDIYKDRSVNRMMLVSPNKWMRRDLMESVSFELQCPVCHNCLISRQDCRKISDMPSEFWVELMDYWHCHKPLNDDQVKVDRYAKLEPLQDELLIGTSFFSVKSTWSTKRMKLLPESIQCAKCQRTLGQISRDCALYNINKWDVNLVRGGLLESYPPELHVASSLLNCLNSNATRVTVLKCSRTERSVLIWLFAVDVDVSLTGSQLLKNCIKVYYKDTCQTYPESSGFQNVENILVPELPFERFVERLRSVNAQLPSAVRTMDSWNLSFIESS